MPMSRDPASYRAKIARELIDTLRFMGINQWHRGAEVMVMYNLQHGVNIHRRQLSWAAKQAITQEVPIAGTIFSVVSSTKGFALTDDMTAIGLSRMQCAKFGSSIFERYAELGHGRRAQMAALPDPELVSLLKDVVQVLLART